MDEEKLSEKLFRFNLSIDQWLSNVLQSANQIKTHQDPRYLFNIWRNSSEGKDWKRQQYKKQKKKCAICGDYFHINNSHIDHIKPIAKYPEFALSLDNLRLVHPKCNASKGISITSLSKPSVSPNEE